MSGIKDIRFPSAMRTISLPDRKSHDDPARIPANSHELIESVVPVTPQIDAPTGGDIAEEFAKARQAAKEGIAADAIIYLRSLSPAAVMEVIHMRRGCDPGVNRGLIREMVMAANEMLEQQKRKKT